MTAFNGWTGREDLRLDGPDLERIALDRAHDDALAENTERDKTPAQRIIDRVEAARRVYEDQTCCCCGSSPDFDGIIETVKREVAS